MGHKPFSTLVKHCVGDAPSRLVQAFKAKVRCNQEKCKFGVRVPFGIKQAMQLDKENGNTFWLDAIKKELACLNAHEVFRMLEKGEEAPKGHQCVP